jgi:hypothetical protein
MEHNTRYTKGNIIKGISIERYEYLKGMGLAE